MAQKYGLAPKQRSRAGADTAPHECPSGGLCAGVTGARTDRGQPPRPVAPRIMLYLSRFRLEATLLYNSWAFVRSNRVAVRVSVQGNDRSGVGFMTYLKFGIAAIALSFGVSVAGAYEVVDTNNGFAGPAFAQSDPDENIGPAVLNNDDFADAHLNSVVDNGKQFDGYSYSGFTFEDQVSGQRREHHGYQQLALLILEHIPCASSRSC